MAINPAFPGVFVSWRSVPGGRFLGFPVRPLAELVAREYDAVVVATFERPGATVDMLVAHGVPPAKCVTLRAPALTVNGQRR